MESEGIAKCKLEENIQIQMENETAIFLPTGKPILNAVQFPH